MRTPRPRWYELRAEGDRQQHWQLLETIHHKVEELDRGGINPVRVLQDQEDGLPRGQAGELIGQGLQQLLLFPLRIRDDR
jgi:hypothetical protein